MPKKVRIRQLATFEQKGPNDLKEGFETKFLALSLRGQEQIKQALSDINPNYTAGITKAKAILSVEEESYGGKLWEPLFHFYWIFDYAHQPWVVEAFSPQLGVKGGITPQRKLWVDYCPFEMLLDFVPSSVHALNESLRSITVEGLYLKSVLKGIELPLDGSAPEETKRKLRSFILSLPETLAKENLEEFYNLHRRFNIPRIYYNINACITQKRLDKIGWNIYWEIVQ